MRNTLIIIVFLTFTNVWSQEKTENVDSLRTKSIELVRNIFWMHPPRYQKWVNDYEDLYTFDQEAELTTLIDNFEKETSFEIAIVTIDTIIVTEDKFEELSLHIAKTWGVGKRFKDNGILIAISNGYRRIRIQNGNGTEKIFTNEETQLVIDNYFIPYFKKEEYFYGTLLGIKEIMRILKSKM
ncbi:TPM domain-containing protein [Flavobacterium lindanitolerans]|uniref:TPM domain-containing protein n=1 Tax=Flavobacterium lindanitolerans TaxID=428988 RepID=UPI0028098D49|nr:TPM domain-containing protein [Flavobacterium lindanitolerans]MDQ7960422.1 TPM domain-containing protein [Flavobacterium lindanitolerans]